MSTQAYEVGQTVELIYRLKSTAVPSSPVTANVGLVVTDPTGIDTTYTALSGTTPSSDSTKLHIAEFRKLIRPTVAGRWRYQFYSTGILVTTDGDAFAVRGVYASTST